ncbi:hydroxyacylglutathione hydrolase [Limnobacter sp.]|uniref:hydroxyacylglutathione hydrolase n=1 Tax=Limnobacter sp. TaxID=2003368 RepID=UPI0035183418
MESFKSSSVAQWSVHGIPAFQDNYIWAIVHQPSQGVVVVDPGCAKSVQSFLDVNGFHLSGILVTHHHMDHVGGLRTLTGCDPQTLPVYGPAGGHIPQVSHPVHEGQRLEVLGLPVKVLEVPGHTLDHLAFVIEFDDIADRPVWMFCGDTLFSAGCGRLFEGSAEQMHHSIQKLNQFPAHTLVFCAHEYTEANLRFARATAPGHEGVLQREREVTTIRKQGMSTIPTTLATERLSNLFMMSKNPIEFKALREAKDKF